MTHAREILPIMKELNSQFGNFINHLKLIIVMKSIIYLIMEWIVEMSKFPLPQMPARGWLLYVGLLHMLLLICLFVLLLCIVCCVLFLKKNLIYALKSPFYSQSLNSSVLLLCVCLLCVSVVLFLCVVFFMASISLVGGLGFLKLVFLLGFMVSLFCVNVVLLLCVMFFASLILPVGWVKVSDIGFSFVIL